MADTIDITPTWQGLLPVILAGYGGGSTTGHRIASDELLRMARLADFANELLFVLLRAYPIVDALGEGSAARAVIEKAKEFRP